MASKTQSLSRETLIREARNRRPTTPLQLWLYVAAFFKFTVPWKTCCPSHDSPFDMLWQLWTGNPASFIAIGARDSYKTLTLAVSETLDLIFNGCGVVHIGAIESQALKCYSYVKKFLRGYGDMLVKDPLMSRTELNNGGHLEIIPCTINRVNSPHEPKVRFDEVELADPVSYNEAKFIAASDERGNQASICYTTTRKFAYGLAQKEIENAIRSHQRVLLWCYKDVTQRCSDERSGVVPVDIYVDLRELKWGRKQEQKEWEHFVVRDGCLKCPIIATCRGDLKRANGIKLIDDVILKFQNATPDYWLAQSECKRPLRKGLMIHRFNPDVNEVVIDWNIFFDREGCFNRERFFMVMGKDWGWNPDATVVCIIDKHTDRVYVIKEFSISQKTTPDVAREIRKWCKGTPFGMPLDMQCDRSEPGLISTMQGHGFAMAQAVDETDIEGGCDLINYLCQPAHGGTPMLYVDKVLCPHLLWEIKQGYIRANDPRTNEPGDKPKDKDNHFVDALRYAVWKYMRKYLEAAGGYANLHDTFLQDQELSSQITEQLYSEGGGISNERELEMLKLLVAD